MKVDYATLYQREHENAKHLPGWTCKKYVPQIKALVEQYQPKNMLDWGCGKAMQYLVLRLHEKWGTPLPHCYDPGVRQLSEKPEGTFDCAICVDVAEHIAEPDLDGFLTELFSKAGKFVFLAVSCRPSKKTFPDGRNLHLTIKPPDWWEAKIRGLVPEGLHVETAYELPA